jgi:flagellar protein FliS
MGGIASYQENSVVTQTPGKLVVMLYDGAIKSIRQAGEAIAARDYERKARCLNKAVAILHELDLSLNMEAGGELANNLRRLYLFMIRHVTEAGFALDTRKLDEVVALLTELNSSWRAVAT